MFASARRKALAPGHGGDAAYARCRLRLVCPAALCHCNALLRSATSSERPCFRPPSPLFPFARGDSTTFQFGSECIGSIMTSPLATKPDQREGVWLRGRSSDRRPARRWVALDEADASNGCMQVGHCRLSLASLPFVSTTGLSFVRQCLSSVSNCLSSLRQCLSLRRYSSGRGASTAGCSRTGCPSRHRRACTCCPTGHCNRPCRKRRRRLILLTSPPLHPY